MKQILEVARSVDVVLETDVRVERICPYAVSDRRSTATAGRLL